MMRIDEKTNHPQRLKLEKANFSISYSTIYRGIYAGMFDTKKERDSTSNRSAIGFTCSGYETIMDSRIPPS